MKTVKLSDPKLNTDNWQEFKISDLFDVVKGKGYNSKEAEENPGYNNFISATSMNNGVAYRTSLENKHKGNRITISSDGACMDAFYQENSFSCSPSVLVLNPNFKEFNKYIGLFICVILELQKIKYHYGRKSNLKRVSKTIIKLPVNELGEPDYQFMEYYIKILSYSAALNIHNTIDEVILGDNNEDC